MEEPILNRAVDAENKTVDVDDEDNEDEIGPIWAVIENGEKLSAKVYSSDEIEIDDEWYRVFKDSKAAGEAAREYFRDMAEHSPEELRSIIGDEHLIQWALGHYSSPGSVGVKSLDEWLDLWLDNPGEHWGSYDGQELNGKISREAADELGIEYDPDDLEVEVVLYKE